MKDKECKQYIHTYKCECETCDGCEFRINEKMITNNKLEEIAKRYDIKVTYTEKEGEGGYIVNDSGTVHKSLLEEATPNDKLIRHMDNLGRIVIPRQIRKDLIGDAFECKAMSIEKVYSSKDKQWGILILPLDEVTK